jgi:hypothetical protein
MPRRTKQINVSSGMGGRARRKRGVIRAKAMELKTSASEWWWVKNESRGKGEQCHRCQLDPQDESTCSSSLLSENWHPSRYPCHQFRNQQAILQMCLGNPRYGLSRCSFWFSIISLGCSEPPAIRMHVNTACHHASVYPSSDRF